MKIVGIALMVSLVAGVSLGQKFNLGKRGDANCKAAARHLERGLGPVLKSPEISTPVITNAPGCYLFLSNDWNYEVCVNQYIRQFRTDGKAYIVAENYLGFAHRVDEISGSKLQYQHERKTVSQSIEEAFKTKISSSAFDTNRPKCMNNNVVSLFSGGTMCGATGKPREAVVKFLCSPEHTDDLPEMMTQINEVETCRYEVVIAGRLACNLLGNQYEMSKEEFQAFFGPVLELGKQQRENNRLQQIQALEKERLRLNSEAEKIASKVSPTPSATSNVDSVDPEEDVEPIGLEPNDQSMRWASQIESDIRGDVDLFAYFGGVRNVGEEDYNIPLSV